MRYVRGAPNHLQAQGKIERRQQTLKNRIPMEYQILPEGLDRQIEALVTCYSYRRYFESRGILILADA